jgi:DNA primase
LKSIDLDRVKQDADLLAIIGHDTNLGNKPAATTNGGEWKGPCPFCGGENRFYVQPKRQPFPRWYCRQCTPEGGSVIDYIAKRDGLDPTNKNDLAEICRRAVGEIPTTSGPRPAPPPKPAYEPPADDWQELAKKIIETCKANLWAPSGKKALEYLKGRGLSESTIERFNLGYSANFYQDKKLFVPRGVLIPCTVAGEVWYLKIRLPVYTGGKKYTQVEGSRPAAIYNADNLAGANMALFCEGEFDCMIATQEFGEIIPTVTLGSATNRPDLATWGAYLLPLQVVMMTYDADEAGSEGSAALGALVGERAKLAPLPEGVKDINDYWKAGGDLRAWIEPARAFYSDPFFMGA